MISAQFSSFFPAHSHQHLLMLLNVHVQFPPELLHRSYSRGEVEPHFSRLVLLHDRWYGYSLGNVMRLGMVEKYFRGLLAERNNNTENIERCGASISCWLSMQYVQCTFGQFNHLFMILEVFSYLFLEIFFFPYSGNVSLNVWNNGRTSEKFINEKMKEFAWLSFVLLNFIYSAKYRKEKEIHSPSGAISSAINRIPHRVRCVWLEFSYFMSARTNARLHRLSFVIINYTLVVWCCKFYPS